MHMTDALLSPGVALAFHAGSAGLLAASARHVVREDGYERRLPLMGVLGAFVFAAQMVNFSIPGTGSSGHVGGGTLLAILLGPSASFLVLASVLTIQALFFADGGLLALGCNVFNLGFWPAFFGVALYRAVARRLPGATGATAGALVAAVVSLELGSLGVVLQTWLSGRAELPLRELALLVTGIHLPIGVVEGLVTAGVVSSILRRVPDRVEGGRRVAARVPVVAALLGAALFVGTVAASFASSRPDGLEWSLARAGAADVPEHLSGVGAWLGRLQERTALLPDHRFAGTRGPRPPGLDAGTSLSGAVGALLVAAAIVAGGAACAWIGRRRSLRDRPP